MGAPPLPPILPPGTQVVLAVPARPRGGGQTLPVGMAAVIVEAPADAEHAYLVRTASSLPATPSAGPALDALLLRLRLSEP